MKSVHVTGHKIKQQQHRKRNTTMSHTTNHPEYNYTVVRQFTIMTIVWGIVGMSVGVLIAAQLIWPALNFDTPWLTYSRLRPLHTNAVIFAFGCSALMATSFYVVQRTCQTRLFGGKLASFVFWGWQAIILSAAISLPLGYTTSKEYAELEWPIDIAITIVPPTSMWRTGSSVPSSSRWPCCTSSTTWKCRFPA